MIDSGMPPGRVLVVGDANPDLVLRGDVVPRFGQAEQILDAADLVLGGSAGIAACGLARLGVPTAISADVGDDMFGRTVLDALGAAGVSTDTVAIRSGEATGLSVHLVVPGDRGILTMLGTISRLSPENVSTAVATFAPAHVHVASPFLTTGLIGSLPELLAAWRDNGITTSIDTNWDPAGLWDGIIAALPHVDILLPNRVELAALGDLVAPGSTDPAAALAALGPRVVVKDGADGGWSLDASGARFSAPGIAIDVVDTAGAGDSFDAGYLAGMAYGVTDESELLRWATVAGSLSTRGAGGTGSQATLAELRALL